MMEGRFFLKDEANTNRMNTRSCFCCCSSSSFSSSCSCSKDTDCHHKAAEFACSACLFCVACPLCIVWCCVKLPCKIGWKAAKNVRHWICCGSQEKVYASYSSFSDIDSDSLSSKLGRFDGSSGSSRYRITHRGLQCRRSSAS